MKCLRRVVASAISPEVFAFLKGTMRCYRVGREDCQYGGNSPVVDLIESAHAGLEELPTWQTLLMSVTWKSRLSSPGLRWIALDKTDLELAKSKCLYEGRREQLYLGRQLCYWSCGKVVNITIVTMMMSIIGSNDNDQLKWWWWWWLPTGCCRALDFTCLIIQKEGGSTVNYLEIRCEE